MQDLSASFRARIKYYEKLKQEELKVSNDADLSWDTRNKALERAVYWGKEKEKYQDMLAQWLDTESDS